VTEVAVERGPLPEERLRAVAELYGRADPKYRSLDYPRHQLERNPYGWSLHAFALADGEPVGHCCVIPVPARTGGRELLSGKVEALYVEERHRDAHVALALPCALYTAAEESGIDVLHAFAEEELGVLHRLLGFRRLTVGEPTWVSVADPSALAGRARPGAVRAVALAQRALATVAAARGRPSVGDPGDAMDLAAVEAPTSTWTISGADAWAWYAGSGLLQLVERPGAAG